MLWKFVLVSTLAAGVIGRSTFEVPDNSPYDEYSQLVATEYCKATNALDKTPEVKSAMQTFGTCLSNVIDIETFAKEMEEVESSGAYDGTIQKYCAKAPELKVCAQDLVEGLSPCLPAGTGRTAIKSTNALIDFVCDNGGARITSFVHADGPRCVRDSMFGVAFCQQAVKANVTKLTNVSGEGIASSLMLSEKERCVLVDQSLDCLVNAVKSCPNPTIGKLGQEFHDVYLESMSCAEVIHGTHAEDVVGPAGAVNITMGSSDAKDIAELNKIKLKLEIRAAELEIWNRENKLYVQHSVLTSGTFYVNKNYSEQDYSVAFCLHKRAPLPPIACFTMIWILALLPAIIPVLTVEAWEKYNALERKQITEYVTKLCTKSGAEDKVPQVLDAIENFEKCSVSLFKDEVLLEEVATAIRNNDLNGVFKKYCARTGRMAACTYSLIDSLALCMGNADLPAAHNFVDQLLGFVCHNDGERIALFIQEGGPQCFQQNVGTLNGCAASVLNEISASQPIKERCTKFDELSKCLVETVSTCSPAAPGDMMRALLAHVRQAMPCAGDDEAFRTYMRWLQPDDEKTKKHI